MTVQVKLYPQSPWIKWNDRIDLVPFVSTATNLATIITKIALVVIAYLKIVPKEKFLKGRPFLQHIDSKDYSLCATLMIPLANMKVALLMADNRKKSELLFKKYKSSFQAAMTSLRTAWEPLSKKMIWEWNPPEISVLTEQIDNALKNTRDIQDLLLRTSSVFRRLLCLLPFTLKILEREIGKEDNFILSCEKDLQKLFGQLFEISERIDKSDSFFICPP